MTTAIAWVPLFAAIVGLLAYALVLQPKISEAGRLLYFAGLLIWLATMATQSIRIGH